MVNSIYEEICYWPRWFYVLLVVSMVGLPVTAFYLSESPNTWLILAPIPVMIVTYVKFARFEWRMDTEGLSYGFRKPRNFVPWSRVKSLQPEDDRFFPYGGWGWRIGGVRDRAYSILGYERGVRVRFDDDRGREWSVFLSSRDPEAACRLAPLSLNSWATDR